MTVSDGTGHRRDPPQQDDLTELTRRCRRRVNTDPGVVCRQGVKIRAPVDRR
jgi:hypothetical protein